MEETGVLEAILLAPPEMEVMEEILIQVTGAMEAMEAKEVLARGMVETEEDLIINEELF